MVTAVIDSTDYIFTGKQFRLNAYLHERSKLKHPHWNNILTDGDRDRLIEELSLKYKSIASHKFQYHADRKHDVIFIDASEPGLIEWANERMYDVHSTIPDWLNPDKKLNLARAIDAHRIILPSVKRVIKLRDILEGKLIDVLKSYVSTPLNEEIYYNWLTQTLSRYPL